MLKLVLASLDGLDDNIKSLYEERNGKYHLKLSDSVVPKHRLDEFRNNNTDLIKKVDELTQTVNGYGKTPEEVQAALAELQEIKDKNLVNEGNFDELLTQRTERMQADYTNQIEKLSTRAETAEASTKQLSDKLNSVLVDSSLQTVVNAMATPRAGAMTDIVSRGRQVWKLDNEFNMVPTDGNATIYGKDGKTPLTMEEWAQDLMQSAGFLFEGDSGSGAGGSSGVGNSGTISLDDARSRAIDQGGSSSLIEDIAGGKVQVK